ncbi:N-acetyltransferase 9-like protein [Coprinopsis cinerea okayama7|uniref:N-acetyltransferase 9-like protein n=1 Tax=Coprinopsis cinerea (strain Okayama-7 / 130 / ATCC MYA-4618 / FGSC 9003) TaxID=240176 RepID=D6RPR6_COPC7|nr:N-acetyltransferase 9-like protein [Coprinopsis cinerea okayama7\|eukprot:XP_002910510.1 N-acetyltransferase 9-like protein [Coprinopsis cinerea okayama7\
MSNEELRELTASEPLTLEEEYEMQEKWQLDEDKLTFIVLSREDALFDEDEIVKPTDPRLTVCPMVGDVNLFLYGSLESLRRPLASKDEGDTEEEQSEDDDGHAEVEIMIAEPSYRRKGYALQALQLMLGYATGCHLGPQCTNADQEIDSPLKIDPTRLLTRISEGNTPSIRLFERLGFQITKRVAVFEEVEMRWKTVKGEQ